MNYLELYDQAMCDLDHDRISFDEFEKRIKPLKEEVRPTGHWILVIEDWNKWTCSECGFSERTDIHVTLGYRFCPKCGAKMESEGAE